TKAPHHDHPTGPDPRPPHGPLRPHTRIPPNHPTTHPRPQPPQRRMQKQRQPLGRHHPRRNRRTTRTTTPQSHHHLPQMPRTNPLPHHPPNQPTARRGYLGRTGLRETRTTLVRLRLRPTTPTRRRYHNHKCRQRAYLANPETKTADLKRRAARDRARNARRKTAAA